MKGRIESFRQGMKNGIKTFWKKSLINQKLHSERNHIMDDITSKDFLHIYGALLTNTNICLILQPVFYKRDLHNARDTFFSAENRTFQNMKKHQYKILSAH